MKPLLSIIVPVYNVEHLLPKCLNSICNQSFNKFELILIDDGSTDQSSNICDQYANKDHRIKVCHQKNSGQSVARNNALKIAKGKYIGFVDADDWIENDMYANLVNSAEQECADIAICRVKRVDEKKNTLQLIGYEKKIVMTGIEATMECLRDDPMPSFPVNKIYRKELFRDVAFPSGRYFEDTATIYKLIYLAHKVVCIPYIGYNYLFNIESTINNNSINIERKIKREYDNALAFGERYMFCKTDKRLYPIRNICANKAYIRIRAFIHLKEHKGLILSANQEREIDSIMKSFCLKDLRDFSIIQKFDYVAYKYFKPLLFLHLRILRILHPMHREI